MNIRRVDEVTHDNTSDKVHPYMLRINQFAKEVSVSNHEVIEVMEKRLGISGKSHSSNLTDDQVMQLRRVFEARQRGGEEATPLALHKPNTAVKIVKAPSVPSVPSVPPTQEKPNPVLLKKAEALPAASIEQAEPNVHVRPVEETKETKLPDTEKPASGQAPVKNQG
jgi:translation initiation factor IF-2